MAHADGQCRSMGVLLSVCLVFLFLGETCRIYNMWNLCMDSYLTPHTLSHKIK